MKSAVGHLADSAPAWFSVGSLKADALVGRARVPKTRWDGDGILLRISGNPTPRVGEETPGTDLPARCPERHIQCDQTFCLGLNHVVVQSDEGAAQWWEQLRQFMACQGVAERTGRWPPGHALDHGNAGKHHERALSLASQAGVEEEYATARLDEPSWLTDPLLRFFDKKGSAINGRAVCPRGCRRRARGRMVRTLRTDCEKWDLLVDLAFAESQRRRALAAYWKSVIKDGTRCCRTMRGCPLGQHEDGGQSAKGCRP